MNSLLTFTSFVCALAMQSSVVARAQTSAEDFSVLQADRVLLQGFAQGDKAILERFLDSELSWIDFNGKDLTRERVLEKLRAPANSDVEVLERIYGNSAVVKANRGRVQVLRVWAKRKRGWRLVLYQEVTLAVKSEPSSLGSEASKECENPCKTIPFEPATESERQAIASWQGVMRAMAENDSEAYAPLIADEFTASDTHHDAAYTKADRLAQIQKQKQAGTRAVPPALISARMFDFGEAVMMIAREQRPNAKAYFNTRMWVKRDGRWQMIFSFNTRIESGS